jgi:hypothetical protein
MIGHKRVGRLVMVAAWVSITSALSGVSQTSHDEKQLGPHCLQPS